MAASNFWTSDFTSGTIKDPKRKFRFRVEMTNLSGGTTIWFAKTATKPSFQIAAAEHKYLNHTFYYPGTVTWQDVTITLVDPTDPDVAAGLSVLAEQGGYVIPADESVWLTMTKSKVAAALGSVNVIQMDGEGADIEAWSLKNAFITEIKYGDLEYGADDLTELSLTLKYDWASMKDVAGNTYFKAGSSVPAIP